MKTVLIPSTQREGFYLKKDRSVSNKSKFLFWIGYKNDQGDISEQRITEAAYIILKTEISALRAHR